MPAFQATIREVVLETADTVTLVLETPDRPPYRAGQFLSIDPYVLPALRDRALALEQVKGRKERARAYSLSSAPHEKLLSITVKEEPSAQFPSLVTPWLVREARPGDQLPCSGFNGLYVLPHDLPKGAHVVHVCAGSGIVPNYAILKDALHRGVDARHTLVFSNRSWDDAIFRESLTALARAHPTRLEVVHAFTRGEAPAGLDAERTRIDLGMLRRRVPDFDHAWFFVCGPSVSTHERRAARERGEEPAPRFLETMRALLGSAGVPRARLFAEGW